MTKTTKWLKDVKDHSPLAQSPSSSESSVNNRSSSIFVQLREFSAICNRSPSLLQNHNSSSVKLKFSTLCLTLFCFSALLAFQVLFHQGYYAPYAASPVVCNNGVSSRDLLSSHSQVASRVRFPRTKRRLPQCIIIGVRKCGTRALLEFLNLHPMIQKAAEEVHFFDDDDNYALGLDWYRRRMPYSFPGQITVEKSPAYFITPSAPARIYSMDPTIKLLLIVRDPVTRLVSDYAQLAWNKARKDRSLSSFRDLVLRPDGFINTSYKAVRIGIYATFFRRWLRTFPRNQIHVVDGDLLVSDPFQEVRKIESFLGLDHRISRDNFYYNHTKGFFCVRNATAAKCLNESKGRKHPQVPPEVLERLREFYKPYNKLFFRQTGMTFSW